MQTQRKLFGVGFHSKHTFLYLHKTVATVFLSKRDKKKKDIFFFSLEKGFTEMVH
jgi:hypothetical protein